MENQEQNFEMDEIEKAEARKTECFTELGIAFFESYRNIAGEKEQKLILEIDDLNRKIRDAKLSMEEEKVLAEQGMIKCNVCHAKIPKDSKFCNYCGNKIGQPAQRKCRNCGAVIKEGYLFCIQCGSKVEEMEKTISKCPNCGEAVEASQLFCIECGIRLK